MLMIIVFENLDGGEDIVQYIELLHDPARFNGLDCKIIISDLYLKDSDFDGYFAKMIADKGRTMEVILPSDWNRDMAAARFLAVARQYAAAEANLSYKVPGSTNRLTTNEYGEVTGGSLNSNNFIVNILNQGLRSYIDSAGMHQGLICGDYQLQAWSPVSDGWRPLLIPGCERSPQFRVDSTVMRRPL
jgi:hypothetical protein